MDNLIYLNNITKLDIPADRVIESAVNQLESVVIVGYDKDGEEYFASSIASGPEVLWLLERAKHRLLTIVEG